jgi:quinoprotein glucose dehydrogenase
VPAVLQATKTGQLFVLDRRTGVPIFPVAERPVPASDVPGETAWPTQPQSAVEALSPQRLAPEDVWGPTPEDLAACREQVTALRYDGPFTPPSLRGTLALPSNVGGAHWGGLAYDPVRRIAVIPVNRIAAVVQLIPRDSAPAIRRRDTGERANGEWEYAQMRGTPYVMRRRILFGPSGMPCTRPPWGTLVAVSLDTGRKLWEVPLGSLDEYASAKAGHAVHLPPGSPNLGGPIVTAGGVVFVGATVDHYLRAFDVETGRELWKGALPASGKATPMTFRLPGGRQTVVIAAGGDGKIFGHSDAFAAFALPGDAGRAGGPRR